jgi:hypothetical protein
MVWVGALSGGGAFGGIYFYFKKNLMLPIKGGDHNEGLTEKPRGP